VIFVGSVALVAVAVGASQSNQVRKSGSQLDRLPANIEQLTQFGERADISPDNQRVAFTTSTSGN
jgi:hypothetical protein